MKNMKEFRDRLLKEDLYNTNVNNYIEKIKRTDNVIIWGTGKASELIYNFLKKFNAHTNIKYYADNSSMKWNSKKYGLQILSPKEVVKIVNENLNSNIIISSQYMVDIRKQLFSLGIKNDVIDVKGYNLAKDYFRFKKETPYMAINSHINEYEKVYSFLSDERSKEVYLGILNCKISLDNKYLEGIADPEKEQYFDKKLIHIVEDEIFCDYGSYNGDTLEIFISLSNGKYKKYIAIEADKEICTELHNKAVQNRYENIQIYNLACWNEKRILKFQPAQTASRVTENGEISVQADTLDNILKDEKVTFLKMDIEGAEQMALKGASRIIKENKPILAISIYHTLEDYYKIPIMIKELDPEYKIFIRHYRALLGQDTICYAIPKNRLK